MNSFWRVRSNPWVLGLASVPFVIGSVGLLIAGRFTMEPVELIAMPVTALGIFATYHAYFAKLSPRRSLEPVWVEGATLCVGTERHPRSALRMALICTAGSGRRIHIARYGLSPPIELESQDERAASTLLSSLGMDVRQSVASFRYESLAQQYAIGLAGVFFVCAICCFCISVASYSPAALLIGMPLFFLAYVASIFWPSRIDVGADGVLLRWAWHRRFIPHEQIRSVRVERAGLLESFRMIVVLDRSEGSVTLPVGSGSYAEDKAALLAARVEQAVEASRSGGSAYDAALLERRGRPHQEWVMALKTLRDRMSYRTAPVAPEALWRIVEGAGISPVARAAAAVALRGWMGPAERTRLATSARATAEPHLRIALDAAASSEMMDAALIEALAELESEELRARTKARLE